MDEYTDISSGADTITQILVQTLVLIQIQVPTDTVTHILIKITALIPILTVTRLLIQILPSRY